MTILDKIMTDYRNLLIKLEDSCGTNGQLVNKAIRRLESLDAVLIKFDDADPSFQAEILDAVIRLRQFCRLRDGIALDANMPQEFWNTSEGVLLAKGEAWLMGTDLITRSQAISILRGYTSTLDICPGDRVAIHALLYPRKNKPTLLGLFARDYLSEKEVRAYVESPTFKATRKTRRHRTQIGVVA